MTSLDGLRALVTGATSGLGRAMASALTETGARVALTGRERARADAVARELGRGAVGVALDVRDERSAEAAVDEVYERLGGLDLLVNNAGIGMRTVNPRFLTDFQPFWDVSPDGFRDVIETKVTGSFLVARALVPRMLAAGGGRAPPRRPRAFTASASSPRSSRPGWRGGGHEGRSGYGSLASMSGETHSVKRHLDVDAQRYDIEIRRLIPDYDEMIATGVELLVALAPGDGHVLDLGGGTGALSAAVLEALPGVHVTMLDVDVEMLDVARRRLARFADRVSFHEGSFLDPLPAADAVVAGLALHHVHDLGAKTALYRAIHDALSPGGVLLNLDAAVTEDARLNALVFDRMAVRMADHGISEAQAHRHFAAWAAEDRYFPLDAELGALREAGFAEVECFWRRGLSAVTCALRAG